MSVEIRLREATFLSDTATDLRRVVNDLSEAQLRYKPNQDSWSIADILEHLAVVEHAFVHHIAPKLADAPAADPSRDAGLIDEQILAFEPDPAATATPEGRELNRVPSVVSPRQRWPPTECAGKFFASRERTVAFLKNLTWHRHEHVIANSGFGPLDAQQWALFLSAHVTRHIRQIDGIRAAPGFPAA